MKFLIAFCFMAISANSFSQCPTTLLSENFNTGPIVGIVPTKIYGGGNWNDGGLAFDGTFFGWFNVRNGLSGDVYDRHLEDCIDNQISISIYLRRSIGAPMNVTIRAEDDFGAVLATSTFDLTYVYVLHTLTFTLGTSTGFNFIMRSNSLGVDGGGDMCAENLIITSDDNALPTASNPAPTTVSCIGDVPAVNTAVITDEADNCSVPTVAFVSQVSNGATCPEVLTRTYSVTDDCGNSIDLTHVITVNDITDPTASNPVPISVECIGDLPPVDIAMVTDAADNCAIPLVAFVSEVSDGGTCPEIITRTYSVSDDCGNSINVTHEITVSDIILPTATAPADVTVECIGDVPVVDVELILDEADNCSIPVVTFVSDVSDGLTCPETIIRAYAVTDDCGNILNVTHFITVNDITNPTASNPAPVVVECIGDVPAIDIEVVIDEADNCTVPNVTFVSDISDGTCPETITRTYAVADACGNTINVEQTITVNDITNPTASNPAPISVSCASDVPAPDPTVVIDEADNCTLPTVAFVSDISNGEVCNNEIITRTYSVTDECGNSINVTQTILIEVTMPFVSAGPDQKVCNGVPVTLSAINPDGAVISWVPMITDGTPFSPPLGGTDYTVTASQCGGECIATDVVTITIDPLPLVNFEPDNLFDCPMHVVNFTNTSTEAYECSWDFGDGTGSNICSPVSYTYTSPGEYDVTLRVESTEGCVTLKTYPEPIITLPNPVAAFSYQPTDLDELDTEVDFYNESVFADEFIWNFGDDSPESDLINPDHLYPIETGGEYIVTLTASNAADCFSIEQKTILIKDVLLYYVPNTFTPDSDGFNERFRPIFTSGYEVYDYHLTILNRWGEIVFESYDSFYGWDGTYGNGNICPAGVYVWQIDFGLTMSDEKATDRGTINLLR